MLIRGIVDGPKFIPRWRGGPGLFSGRLAVAAMLFIHLGIGGRASLAQIKLELPRTHLGRWQLDVAETRAFHERRESPLAEDWFAQLGSIELELRDDKTFQTVVDSFSVDPPFLLGRGTWRLVDAASNWSYFEIEVRRECEPLERAGYILQLGLRAADTLIVRAPPHGHWLALKRQPEANESAEGNPQRMLDELKSRLVGGWSGDWEASRGWWNGEGMTDEWRQRLEHQARTRIDFSENWFRLIPPDETPQRATIGRWRVNAADVSNHTINLFGSIVNNARYGHYFTITFLDSDRLALRIDQDMQFVLRRITQEFTDADIAPTFRPK